MCGRVTAVLSVFFALVACSFASDDENQYLNGTEFFISNVAVVDGLGSQPLLAQDLSISDGKIVSVTPTATTEPPAGAVVIDGAGRTVMPGLIDTHTHIRSQWHGGIVLQDKYPQTREHKPLQQNLAAYLYAGVTGVFNVGDATDFAIEVRDKLASGEFIGPRLETTGMPFSQHPSAWEHASTWEDLFGIFERLLGKVFTQW